MRLAYRHSRVFVGDANRATMYQRMDQTLAFTIVAGGLEQKRLSTVVQEAEEKTWDLCCFGTAVIRRASKDEDA